MSKRKSWKEQVPTEDRSMKTIKRRKAIKEILTKKGAKGIVDIQSTLKSDYGIITSRPTLYADMANLGGITDDDMVKIELRIVGLINNMLNTLKNISEDSDDERNQIAAINSTFGGIKTLYQIANAINQRSASRGLRGDEPRNITPQIVVRIGGESEPKKLKEKNE